MFELNTNENSNFNCYHQSPSVVVACGNMMGCELAVNRRRLVIGWLGIAANNCVLDVFT